jgi:hypothetical protein
MLPSTVIELSLDGGRSSPQPKEKRRGRDRVREKSLLTMKAS